MEVESVFLANFSINSPLGISLNLNNLYLGLTQKYEWRSDLNSSAEIMLTIFLHITIIILNKRIIQ